MLHHPKGRENGWTYSYGLIESQKWKKQGKKYDLSLDIYYQLMCSSLQPKIWVPLDRSINEDAMNNRVFNYNLKCWELDDETRLIYLIARSVFDKTRFTDAYVKEIEKKAYCYNNDSFINKMNKVFFNFTDNLLDLLKNKQYSEIIERYITFTGY